MRRAHDDHVVRCVGAPGAACDAGSSTGSDERLPKIANNGPAQRLRFAAVINLEAKDASVACRGGEGSVDRLAKKASMSTHSRSSLSSVASHHGSGQYNREQDRWTAHRCEDDDVRQP